MSIENEVKFLLSPLAFHAILEDHEVALVDIHQHYVSEGTRVRMVDDHASAVQYIFTFKKNTPEGLVEIETPISQDDFESLKNVSQQSIKKTRGKVVIGDIDWDVDLFTTSQGSFVIAEAEMPPGMETPDTLPAFVENHLVRSLGRDVNWSNQSLSTPGRLAETALLVSASIKIENTMLS